MIRGSNQAASISHVKVRNVAVRFKAITKDDGKGIFHLYPRLCKGCGLCIEKCPVNTIGWAKELESSALP